MKNRIGLIFSLVLALGLCVVMGFVENPTINEVKKNSSEETVAKNVDHTVESKDESIVAENEVALKTSQPTEVLSEGDRAVKAEIAKYIDTDVDFSQIQKEKIKGKEINVSFSRVEKIGEKEKVIYENSLGDEIIYSGDNGKLFLARINSVATEKTAQSIDLNLAKKIATEYASEKCNVSEYTLDYTSEDSRGYIFGFSKYILGYDTDASIEIGVGFDGAIVYIRDNTDVFDGMDINITVDWINSKAQQMLAEFEFGTAAIQNIHIGVNDGKPCLIVSIAHSIKSDGSIGATVGAFIIPFE